MTSLLRRVAEGLWEIDRPQRAAGFELGHRMCVARLASGRLWVHSPVRIDPGLAAEVDALGEVDHIVAPSVMHDLYLDGWLDRYQTAVFHAPPGLATRHPPLRQPRLLGSDPPGAWNADFDQELAGGIPRLNEVVFLHRPSRTLLVADLIFNLPRGASLVQRALQSANGVAGRPAVSRLFRLQVRHRAALRRSLDRILAWDFDRLLPGHGTILETGGKEALRLAYGWM